MSLHMASLLMVILWQTLTQDQREIFGKQIIHHWKTSSLLSLSQSLNLKMKTPLKPQTLLQREQGRIPRVEMLMVDVVIWRISHVHIITALLGRNKFVLKWGVYLGRRWSTVRRCLSAKRKVTLCLELKLWVKLSTILQTPMTLTCLQLKTFWIVHCEGWWGGGGPYPWRSLRRPAPDPRALGRLTLKAE